jgi:hypothetical protein
MDDFGPRGDNNSVVVAVEPQRKIDVARKCWGSVIQPPNLLIGVGSNQHSGSAHCQDVGHRVVLLLVNLSFDGVD